MKRVIMSLLIVTLITAASASIAQTDRRGAIEFSELYTQRYTTVLLDYSLDYENVIPSDFPSSFYDELYTISSSAGSLDIRKDDFTVAGFLTTFKDLNADENDNYERLLKCVVAISALEYDYSYDQLSSILSNVSDEYENGAVEQAIALWTSSTSSLFLDDQFWARVYGGEKVVIINGNYTYSITYFETTLDGKVKKLLFLIADAYY